MKTAQDKTERIAYLARRITERRNGNRARQLAGIVRQKYQSNPEEIMAYFSHPNEYIQGIATSTYGMLTGNLYPIRKKTYGGWGINLKTSPGYLFFYMNQLWFAKLEEDALINSTNAGNALRYSVNKGRSLSDSINGNDALQGSCNTENSLAGSRNYDNVLANSINMGRTLCRSKNSGNTLFNSVNLEDALNFSENSGNSLIQSINGNNALSNSHNIENSLIRSINCDYALRNSVNGGSSLYFSKNKGNALFSSDNTGNSLDNSMNSGNALNTSKNRGMTLWHSENSEEALSRSQNDEGVAIGSMNTGNTFFNSTKKGRQILIYKEHIQKDRGVFRDETAYSFPAELSSKLEEYSRFFGINLSDFDYLTLKSNPIRNILSSMFEPRIIKQDSSIKYYMPLTMEIRLSLPEEESE